jgi:hypothetical protein
LGLPFINWSSLDSGGYILVALCYLVDMRCVGLSLKNLTVLGAS